MSAPDLSRARTPEPASRGGAPASARRPRLLVVCNYFPPQGIGGAEVVAARQARAMLELGWEVRVFAADTEPGGRPPGQFATEEMDGLRVLRAHVDRSGAFEFLNPSAEAPFVQALREFGPDVVHFHNLVQLGFNLAGFAQSAGARIVFTLHDRGAFCFKGTLLRNDLSPCEEFGACAACRPALPTPHGALPPRLRQDYVLTQLGRAHRLLAPSRGLADDFMRAGIDPGKLSVLSSGIELAAIAPRLREAKGPVRFACAAYLGEHKGIAVLAEALRILWSDRALRGRWRFLIAGDGELAPMLRGLVQEEGMEQAVETPGRLPREQVLARLSQADVAVLPSICVENQPVWLLEGLASGAALVASRVGGSSELVEHGVNGLLYPRRDAAALAESLRELILSPDRIALFSAENLRRRERYSAEAVGGALDRIYRDETGADAKAPPDLVFACGIDRRSAAEAVQSTPQEWHGRRVRLIWWRWAIGPGVEAPLWLFSLGRRWQDWARALLVLGPGPLLRRALMLGRGRPPLPPGRSEEAR